jgi:NTP pyrophosphatase (non-canonical NTP hydrolase)
MIHPHVTILADRQMNARAITERAAAARAPREPLPQTAARLADRLREHFDPATLPVQQVLALAEEAGEFTAAYRRWAGLARRTGPWHDVEAELADVVITAYVTAHVLGIDLDAACRAKTEVVFTRGWREPPPAA